MSDLTLSIVSGLIVVAAIVATVRGATFRGKVGWTGAEIEIGPRRGKKPPGRGRKMGGR